MMMAELSERENAFDNRYLCLLDNWMLVSLKVRTQFLTETALVESLATGYLIMKVPVARLTEVPAHRLFTTLNQEIAIRTQQLHPSPLEAISNWFSRAGKPSYKYAQQVKEHRLVDYAAMKRHHLLLPLLPEVELDQIKANLIPSSDSQWNRGGVAVSF